MFYLRNIIVLIVLLFAASFILSPLSAQTPEEERKSLEEELQTLETQIQQYEKDITKTQQEKNTLKNRISAIKKEINKLNLQISQGNLMIKDLGVQIKDTEKSVEATSIQVENYRERLAALVRILYQESQKSLIEILLAEPDLSSFSANLAALERLHEENFRLVTNIKDLKTYLENQKISLDDEKDDLERLVTIQTLQKNQSLSKQREEESLLRQTEGQEQIYQQILAATRQRAAQIKARIFELIGVPEAPTFGEAVEMAKSVQAIAGVRPAFLLAVMTQESNIGKNVGQCYLKDTGTGGGVRVNGVPVSNVMKPSRDIQPFLQITGALGRDPLNTPVSCPIPSVGGYGGAMGPAQFIPSTWMIYKSRLDSLIGKSADPWNIKDAFLAAGVYLADAGAASQTYNKEWCAAIAYFSGSCSSRNQKRYGFYANSVMAIAADYEEDIKAISQY